MSKQALEATRKLPEVEWMAKLDFVKMRCKYFDNVGIMVRLDHYELQVECNRWTWLRASNKARSHILDRMEDVHERVISNRRLLL